jgi:hypothetical protein
LSQDELLAKIDALDWDDPMPITLVKKKKGGAVPRSRDSDRSTSSLRVVAIVSAIACVLAGLYFVLTPAAAPKVALGEAPTKPISVASSRDAPPVVVPPPPADAGRAEGAETRAAPGVDAGGNPVQEVAPEVSAVTTAEAAIAEEEKRAALALATAMEEAEAKAQKQLDARRKARAVREARAAREAERAKLAAQQERELRLKEELRLQTEREAAEAARLAKAREQESLPKGPSSPKELCAGEGGAIARGICEARACGRAEWRAHPFCVKRIEDQLRAIGQGGG